VADCQPGREKETLKQNRRLCPPPKRVDKKKKKRRGDPKTSSWLVKISGQENWGELKKSKRKGDFRVAGVFGKIKERGKDDCLNSPG